MKLLLDKDKLNCDYMNSCVINSFNQEDNNCELFSCCDDNIAQNKIKVINDIEVNPL